MAVLYCTNSLKVLDKAKITLYISWCGYEDGTSAAATALASRLPESVVLKHCYTFLKSYKAHVAHLEESWRDGKEGLFQEYKMWLPWYKCACYSLAYFSRNSETRSSQHEKKQQQQNPENKTVPSIHQKGKRQNVS